MEINVRDLLNKVKSTAQQVGTKATQLGKEWVSNTKLNFRIMELGSQIDADFKAAGKLLYAVHCGEEIDSEAIDEILAQIDGKQEELEALKEALAKAKAAYTCPNCGKNVGKSAAYCSSCGTKIERPEPEIEVEVVEGEFSGEECEASVAESEEEAGNCCENAAQPSCCAQPETCPCEAEDSTDSDCKDQDEPDKL